MIEELKEQIHERVYNLKVPTLGFSRRDLFDIAIEYAEPREKQLQEKDKKIKELEQQIEKMKRCFNCKYHDKFVESKCDECEVYSKWEIKE